MGAQVESLNQHKWGPETGLEPRQLKKKLSKKKTQQKHYQTVFSATPIMKKLPPEHLRLEFRWVFCTIYCNFMSSTSIFSAIVFDQHFIFFFQWIWEALGPHFRGFWDKTKKAKT